MPTTGLGVKLGMPTSQLTERGARTVFIPRAVPRFSSLIGYSNDVVKRHYVEFGLFGVASDSGYVFFIIIRNMFYYYLFSFV